MTTADQDIAARYAASVVENLDWNVGRSSSALEAAKKHIAEAAGDAAAGKHLSSSYDQAFLRYRVAHETDERMRLTRDFLSTGDLKGAGRTDEPEVVDAPADRVALANEWYQQGVRRCIDRMQHYDRMPGAHEKPNDAAVAQVVEALREAHRFAVNSLARELAIESRTASGLDDPWAALKKARAKLSEQAAALGRARKPERQAELEGEIAALRAATASLEASWEQARAEAEQTIARHVGAGVAS
jgi:hypothetical protein